MKNSKLYPSLVLCTIGLVAALLLSGVNMITAPMIEEAQNAAANAALLEVLPDGKNFEKIDITSDYPAIVTAGYKADGGFVFQMTVTGKSTGLVIMCGIDADGNVVGTKVIANEETPSYAEKVFPQVEGTAGKYNGMGLDGFDPYLVSGATLTSKAYGEAIKAALQSAVLAAGGSVDTRTPEQILQDNCNAALGTTGLKFNKWFALEVFEGIDAVYTAEDKSGKVYVVGETFVAVQNGAVVTTDVSEEVQTAIIAADSAIDALTLEDVTKPEGAKKTVQSIQKASNGTYVFNLLADGYQEKFDWGNGTQINIQLSISADGKIIDVVTLYHEESKGYGDACATEEYYEEYLGKGDEDIKISSTYPSHNGTDLIPSTSTDVGVIASATYTTVGYQTAIKDAFAAFELITAQGGEE